MSESKKATVENACLLVKLKADPKTYHVVLPMASRLMLVQLASSLSPKGVLEVGPFDGVEFKSATVEPPMLPQLVVAKAFGLAESFALARGWKRGTWSFIKFKDDDCKLAGLTGLNKSRMLWVVRALARAGDITWAQSEGRRLGFKVIEVDI